MKIIEIIKNKNANLWGPKSATIVFLGDSVTQGCFENFYSREGQVCSVFDQDKAFSVKVKKILNFLYPIALVNVINSGIAAQNANSALERFDRDVVAYSPDLVVIGFALNDSGGKENGKESYAKALRELFNKTKALGSECIFLTPNMMNDNISPYILDERYVEYIKTFQENPLDEYVEIAKNVAKECGVVVCDVYEEWKTLQKNGVNITELLSNKLNHPVREMHWLTAYKLVETMIKN